MFLLAQVSDLLYFFFLMFLSEAIFNASKETIYGIILLFFTFKIILLYTYINKQKYNIFKFFLLHFSLFIFPIFYFIGKLLNIKITFQYEIICYILLFFSLILNLIIVYKNSNFRIWKVILIFLYLYVLYYLILFICMLIGEISL